MIDLPNNSFNNLPVALEHLCPPPLAPVAVGEVDHLEDLPVLAVAGHHVAADDVVHVVGGRLLLVHAPGARLLLRVYLHLVAGDTQVDVNLGPNLENFLQIFK